MATSAEADDPENRARIPMRRFLARAARLSSAATLVILGLYLAGFLAIGPTAIGLLVAFAFGSLLAHAREKRLLAVERQLQRLMVVSDDRGGGFELLGGDALPVMTE